MTRTTTRVPAWGEKAVLLGLWLGLLCYLIPRLLIGPLGEAYGGQPGYSDIGNAFEKAAAVARYGDLRLVRAVAGNPLPEPPRILGSATTARVAWALAIGSSLFVGAVAVIATRTSP